MNGLAGYAGDVVSPLLTQAIESTRQALMNANPPVLAAKVALARRSRKGVVPWSGAVLPAVDDHRRLDRLAADCRMTVLEFEATSGLMFSPAAEAATLSSALARKAGVTELVTLHRPKIEVLQAQADEVVRRQRDRLKVKSDSVAERDRLAEVNAQVSPPLAFWSAALPLQPDVMPRTLDLIVLTLSVCNLIQQRFKHALAVPRPHRVNLAAFPAILTPSHGSLPSGHATEAFAVAEVLSALLDEPFGRGARRPGGMSGVLLALAARIADNRELAGVHFPIDSLAGRMLGTVIATYLVARCGAAGPAWRGTFNALGPQNFNAPDALGWGLRRGNDPLCTLKRGAGIQPSAALNWLWTEARKEWGG
ncbi:MAG: phosphatase PAP2 family protein [Rubrivivax sp.]|nr:phosphatase PAP2 family protein [Rubrivivax sp.]